MTLLKTLLFLLIVPGFVLFFVPLVLPLLPALGSASCALALPLWTVGTAALLWCAWDFVRRGRGTPAPIDPPKELVVTGLYRHVRNPMYLGALLVLLGHVLWFGSLCSFMPRWSFWPFTSSSSWSKSPA